MRPWKSPFHTLLVICKNLISEFFRSQGPTFTQNHKFLEISKFSMLANCSLPNWANMEFKRLNFVRKFISLGCLFHWCSSQAPFLALQPHLSQNKKVSAPSTSLSLMFVHMPLCIFVWRASCTLNWARCRAQHFSLGQRGERWTKSLAQGFRIM